MCLHSNILKLTNEFSFSDQNITLDNYDNWLIYLNSSYPDRVDSLKLRHCDLQRFLDQVSMVPTHVPQLLLRKHFNRY